jgi:hypothetical protein
MGIDPKIPLSTQLGFEEYELTPVEPIKTSLEEPEIQENAFNVNEVQELARTSLDFLAAMAIPTVFKYCFPIVFKTIWNLLTSYVLKIRDFSQLAIGLPRGFGKTMLLKIFILFCILFTRKQFILYICGTQTKANNVLADILGMLNQSNIIKTFGDWKIGAETDRLDLKRFGFRGRNIILMGAGANSDIRGITLENIRPDVIIFDDIQTRQDAESETITAALETWMVGTAMKTKSPEGCLFVFIANMYPTKFSLLRKLKSNPTWIKFIAGGILANGESLWEELQPVEQLLKEFENDLAMGRPEIFYAEVLNDETASVNTALDISKIPECPFSDDELPQGSFIIIDPATDKANADAVSIGYFEIFDEKPVIKEIKEGRFSPGDTIEEALELALRKNCSLIAIESNAYQYSLNYWFNYITTQKGIIGINPVEVYSGVASKNSRILKMFRSLLAGEQYIHSSCKTQVLHQATQFNPIKTNNVDGILDLLTYPFKVIELYGEFILSQLTLQMQEFNSMPVRTELETSPF